MIKNMVIILSLTISPSFSATSVQEFYEGNTVEKRSSYFNVSSLKRHISLLSRKKSIIHVIDETHQFVEEEISGMSESIYIKWISLLVREKEIDDLHYEGSIKRNNK